MKILLLSNNGNEIREENYKRVNNISAVYGYFYYKNMLKYIENNKLDIQVYIDKVNYASKIDEEYDFCFVLYNRGIKNMSDNVFNRLRSYIKKKIITIAPTSKIVGKEDILLYYVGKNKKKCFKINWTADKFELYPEQKDYDKIRILVDHKYYGKEDSRIAKVDQTEQIIKSLLKYKEKNKNIEIIQIETESENKYRIIESEEDISNYNRHQATSFKNIFKIYRSASLFFVTHPECMGLSTLECNMAGCKVLIPKTFIKDCFSKNLHKFEFDPVEKGEELILDYDEIIKNINPAKSHRKAHKQNYYNSVTKIFKKIILK